jgi:hypothetical protein
VGSRGNKTGVYESRTYDMNVDFPQSASPRSKIVDLGQSAMPYSKNCREET